MTIPIHYDGSNESIQRFLSIILTGSAAESVSDQNEVIHQDQFPNIDFTVLEGLYEAASPGTCRDQYEIDPVKVQTVLKEFKKPLVQALFRSDDHLINGDSALQVVTNGLGEIRTQRALHSESSRDDLLSAGFTQAQLDQVIFTTKRVDSKAQLAGEALVEVISPKARGSAVIVSRHGDIASAYHVFFDAEGNFRPDFKLKLNRKEIPIDQSMIVASDPIQDLIFFRIPYLQTVPDLPAAAIAESIDADSEFLSVGFGRIPYAGKPKTFKFGELQSIIRKSPEELFGELVDYHSEMYDPKAKQMGLRSVSELVELLPAYDWTLATPQYVAAEGNSDCLLTLSGYKISTLTGGSDQRLFLKPEEYKMASILSLDLKSFYQNHQTYYQIQASVDIRSGDSGSALFQKDSEGNWLLVGITHAAQASLSRSFFAPLIPEYIEDDSVKEELQGIKDWKKENIGYQPDIPEDQDTDPYPFMMRMIIQETKPPKETQDPN